MYRREAVRRLKDHFRIHHDDRLLTPYLDEAAELAYDALDRYDQILTKFGSFKEVMNAEKVVRCSECVFYNLEELKCKGFIEDSPRTMIPDGYCSQGMTVEFYENLMKAAEEGAFDRVHILSASEIKAALSLAEKEKESINNEP